MLYKDSTNFLGHLQLSSQTMELGRKIKRSSYFNRFSPHVEWDILTNR